VSINQRIEEVEIFYRKKGIKTVYKQMGIPQATFSGMKKEGANMMVGNLFKMLEYATEFNPLWIVFGQLPKLVEDIGQVQEPKMEYTLPPSKILMNWMDSMQSRIEELEAEVKALKAKDNK